MLVNSIIVLLEVNPLADTSVLENQIDFLVYHLYGLTYDEVLIVDPEILQSLVRSMRHIKRNKDIDL